jgi:hypothetical protein
MGALSVADLLLQFVRRIVAEGLIAGIRVCISVYKSTDAFSGSAYAALHIRDPLIQYLLGDHGYRR